jgi:hypothetical protein
VLAAVAAAALVVVGATAPLRGSALGDPTVLRPQRFAPISVSHAPGADPGWSAFPAHHAFDDSRFGRPGPRTDPRVDRLDSTHAAEAMLRRDVRLPAILPESVSGDPSVTLHSASSYSYILDLPKIHQALATAGIDDVQLPTVLHGAPIIVNVPAGVALEWGDRANGLRLVQGRAPSLTIPPGVDVAGLRELLLNDPRVARADPDIVSQLRAIDDWQSALPVPIDGVASTLVQVDGVDALLVVADGSRPAHRTLTWRRAGSVFALSGRIDEEMLITVAASIR